ncbi:TIGR04197 family type VII secretion effector [Terribacillus saccharophilus]|uniref:TIGR04197 family type VII secretion effector n=1 Tax=Terribacillus saccharophilus TaxID=361277 RepID=UPI00380C25F0
MGKEVAINMEVFESNVSSLKASAEALLFSQHKSYTLEKTNIAPFTKDLEQMIKAIELLEKYKAMLTEDIQTLKEVGETMRDTDEQQGKK